MIENNHTEVLKESGTMFALFNKFKEACGQFNKKCTGKIEPLKRRQENLMTDLIQLGREIAEDVSMLLLEMGGEETRKEEDPPQSEKSEEFQKSMSALYKKVLTGGVRLENIERIFKGEKRLVLRNMTDGKPVIGERLGELS